MGGPLALVLDQVGSPFLVSPHCDPGVGGGGVPWGPPAASSFFPPCVSSSRRFPGEAEMQGLEVLLEEGRAAQAPHRSQDSPSTGAGRGIRI